MKAMLDEMDYQHKNEMYELTTISKGRKTFDGLFVLE